MPLQHVETATLKRGSHFKIPLNLYNIVVARSGKHTYYLSYNDLLFAGYGKSTALDIAERGMNAAATFFSSEFAETMPAKATDSEKKVPAYTITIKSKSEKTILL